MADLADVQKALQQKREERLRHEEERRWLVQRDSKERKLASALDLATKRAKKVPWMSWMFWFLIFTARSWKLGRHCYEMLWDASGKVGLLHLGCCFELIWSSNYIYTYILPCMVAFQCPPTSTGEKETSSQF